MVTTHGLLVARRTSLSMIVNCTPSIASPPAPPQGPSLARALRRASCPLCQSGQPRRSGTGPGPWHQRRSRPAPPPSCWRWPATSRERSRARSSPGTSSPCPRGSAGEPGSSSVPSRRAATPRRPLQPELSRPNSSGNARAGSSSAGGAGQDERGSRPSAFWGRSCWRPLSSWWRPWCERRSSLGPRRCIPRTGRKAS